MYLSPFTYFLETRSRRRHTAEKKNQRLFFIHTVNGCGNTRASGGHYDNRAATRTAATNIAAEIALYARRRTRSLQAAGTTVC